MSTPVFTLEILVMAGREMTPYTPLHIRVYGSARLVFPGVRTARVEGASGGRIARARDVALQDDSLPLLAAFRVRSGDR